MKIVVVSLVVRLIKRSVIIQFKEQGKTGTEIVSFIQDQKSKKFQKYDTVKGGCMHTK